jgi:hypothetical protein
MQVNVLETLLNREWESNYCVTPSQQSFNYIIARTSWTGFDSASWLKKIFQ